MKGVELQAILESKFTIPIPDELMFEPDATLETIANSLISGFFAITSDLNIITIVNLHQVGLLNSVQL